MELTKQMQIEKKKMLEKFERMKKKGRLTQMGGGAMMHTQEPMFMSQTAYVKKRRMSDGGPGGGLSMLDTTAEQTQLMKSIEPEEERKLIPMRQKLSPIVTKKGPILKTKLDPSRKQSLHGTAVHSRSNTIAMKPLGEKPKLKLDFNRALKQNSKSRLSESNQNAANKQTPGRKELKNRIEWEEGLESA